MSELDERSLRQAYRLCSRTLHPDPMASSSPEERDAAEEQIRQVNQAYELVRKLL